MKHDEIDFTFEDELINKVKVLYQDFIIKNSSLFIDNKINDELSKLMIDSFNNKFIFVLI